MDLQAFLKMLEKYLIGSLLKSCYSPDRAKEQLARFFSGAVLFYLILTGSSYAQVYKWIDNQGIVHFSDTPHTGAQPLQLNAVQQSTPPALSSKTNTVSTKSLTNQHQYQEINISQPLNESTIRNNQGSFLVAVELVPKLMSGDVFQLLLDGKAYGDEQTEVVFEVDGINRGAHTLQVQVLNAQGLVLITSTKITLFMHRPRIN